MTAKEVLSRMYDNEIVQIRDSMSAMMLAAGKACDMYLANDPYLNCEVEGITTTLDDKSRTVCIVLYVGEEKK